MSKKVRIAEEAASNSERIAAQTGCDVQIVVEPETVNVEHLTVYYDSQRGDQCFCVDEDHEDNADGTRNPGNTGMRFATPAEAARFVQAWLEAAADE